MEKLKKLTYAKAVDSDKKLVSGYVSTYGWDRDMERFIKGAWDFSNYLKNPVVLWSHNIAELPIARTVDLKEDDLGVFAIAEFDKQSQRSMEIFSLFERKFLNAFSVGFLRKNYQMADAGNGEKGLEITEAELYEYSAVSVPANPGALVTREVAELVTKTLGAERIEIIKTKSAGELFMVTNGPKDGEENPDDAEPAAGDEPVQPVELEAALKSVTELARVAKGSQLDETKRGLIMTAMSVFNEVISEHKQKVNPEELLGLKDALIGLAGVTASLYPSAAVAIQKTISQIEKALTSREG